MKLPDTILTRENDVQFRLLEPDNRNDRSHWMELHTSIFHKKITEDVWNWIFLANPLYLHTKPLIILAEKGDSSIGSACLIPASLMYSDGRERKVVPACFAGKSMVLPEFRGHHFYTHMLEQRMQLAAEQGYKLLLTYTSNPHVHHTLVSKGWKEFTTIIERTFLLPIQSGSRRSLRSIHPRYFIPRFFYHLSSGLDRAHSFQIRHQTANECIPLMASLHDSISRTPGFFGDRSIPYLTWRYGRRRDCFHCITAEKDGSSCGYIVLYVGNGGEKKFSMLLDFYANQKIVAKHLLLEAIQYLQNKSFNELWIELHFRDEFLSPLTTPLFGFTARRTSFYRPTKLKMLYYSFDLPEDTNLHPRQFSLFPGDNLSNFTYL